MAHLTPCLALRLRPPPSLVQMRIMLTSYNLICPEAPAVAPKSRGWPPTMSTSSAFDVKWPGVQRQPVAALPLTLNAKQINGIVMRLNRYEVQMGVPHACVPAGTSLHCHAPLDAGKPRKRQGLTSGFILFASPRLPAGLLAPAQRSSCPAADYHMRAARLMDGLHKWARIIRQPCRLLPWEHYFV